MPRILTTFTALAILSSPVLASQCSSTHHASQQSGVVEHAKHMVVHKTKDKKQDADIVDTAASIDDFSTLVAAVKAAGLVDALKGEGPFTVFAPTNEAFEKLPEGTVEDLLKEENKEKLTNILLYHVVPGKVLAKDVVKVESADTLLKDESVKVKVKEDKVFIDKAEVIKTDVETSNGVIHVIDSVLLP